jgi:hypothetical protein
LGALHGGAISAHSDGAGRGSTFTVRLPRAEAVVHEAKGSSPTRPLRRRVLVVEDEADAREALRHLLEMDGHDVEPRWRWSTWGSRASTATSSPAKPARSG